MTLEDLMKHMANNPLVWKENEYGSNATVMLEDDEDADGVDFIDFSIDFDIMKYQSSESINLSILFPRRDYVIARSSGYRIPDEDLMALAEEHRLRMVCRLLGIKD